MVLAATGTLLGARRVHSGAWTATCVAALYLAYRGIGYVLLTAANFPPSFIPIMVLSVGIVVDLTARWQWRPAKATIILLIAFYASTALIGRLVLMPVCDPRIALVIALPIWYMHVAARRY
jgi:hypothetical protein